MTIMTSNSLVQCNYTKFGKYNLQVMLRSCPMSRQSHVRAWPDHILELNRTGWLTQLHLTLLYCTLGLKNELKMQPPNHAACGYFQNLLLWPRQDSYPDCWWHWIFLWQRNVQRPQNFHILFTTTFGMANLLYWASILWEIILIWTD